MDYFRFQRRRIYLPLNLDAVQAKFPGNDAMDLARKCEDPAWHPHVVLEARPTFGARQYVRTVQQEITMRQSEAEKRLAHRIELAKAEVEAMSDGELKASCDAFERGSGGAIKVKTRAALVNAMHQGQVAMDPEVAKAVAHAAAVRCAIGIRSLGGDFTCYSGTWDATPKWPALDDDGAVEARIKILERLDDDDVSAIAAAVRGTMEVDDEEAGKSEAPQVS